MTRTFDVDGNDLAPAIREESVELVTAASQGEIGQGRFTIDDPAGTIATTGWKDIEVGESTTTPSRIFTGFVHGRRIHRGPERAGPGREIQVTTMDGNDLLRRLLIVDTKKRPSESVSSRVNWLLANELSRVGVSDYGRVQSSSVMLDADKSVKGRYPVDVLAPIAKAIGFNYYVRWNADEGGWELVFREPSEEDICTIAISNVLSDVDGVTTFAPWQEADLSVDPEHVYSGTYSTHDKGNIYLRRSSTATAFTDRDGITEDMGIRKDSTARRDARKFLDASDSEEQILENVIIKVPATHTGLVEAGMRISTRMQHLEPEGWDPAIYPNILRLRKSIFTDGDWRLSMDLALPETGEADSSCPYALTESGIYYPLGGTWTADIPPTPNISNGPAYYCRPGIFYPVVPTTNHQGYWHFAQFDGGGWGYFPGGPGTIDWAGDCVSNELRFIVVGSGTMTIQTEAYSSGIRTVGASWGPSPGGYENNLGTFSSGDVIGPIEIDNDCVSIVHVYDVTWPTCGGKWGWSAMEWEAA